MGDRRVHFPVSHPQTQGEGQAVASQLPGALTLSVMPTQPWGGEAQTQQCLLPESTDHLGYPGHAVCLPSALFKSHQPLMGRPT